MASNRTYKISAIDDGNCAFNAFTLALFKSDFVNALNVKAAIEQRNLNNEYGQFIQAVANALNIQADWKTISEHLIALRENDPGALQTKIAPIMRRLAIDKLEVDSAYPHKTLNAFLSAFHNFVLQNYGLPVANPDDIYNRQAIITDEFAHIAENLLIGVNDEFDCERFSALRTNLDRTPEENNEYKNLLDELITLHQSSLTNWWLQIGHKQFLQAMRKEGEWAGDLELAPLANYFGLNLDVKYHQTSNPHRIHHANGEIPANLDEEQKKQLIVRGIVDKPDDGSVVLKLLPMNEEEVVSRLNAVPQYDEVFAIISSAADLAHMEVPHHLSASCLTALRERGVINHQGDAFTVNKEEAASRIMQVPSGDEILEAWQTNYNESPIMTLLNPHGVHYDAMLIQPDVIVEPEGELPLQELPSFKDFNIKNCLADDLIHAWKNGNIQYNREEHLSLMTQAEETAKTLLALSQNGASSPLIKYSIFKSTQQVEVTVSEEMQIKLDEQYAKQLQLEEFTKLVNRG